MSVPDWNDRLRALLCRLYEMLGGNCSDLGTTPADQINSVSSEYGPGAPPQSQWATTNQILDELSALEAEGDNPLSAADDQSLKNLIAMVRGKVT